VFERFTSRARQVVVLAQEEARSLKHNYIGTEHLLLGLVREEEGVAARVLAKLEIGLDDIRAEVARIVGEGNEAQTGQIPFTPRAKKVLELALREAMSLGHNYIGTEHILLGLARENNGVAAQILLAGRVDAELIRREVIELLGLHPDLANVELARKSRRFGRPRPGVGRVAVRATWEYRIDRRELDEQWLNELGAEGWELVDISSGSFVFKRPQLPGDLRAAG
jgi:ATP-dependent Clp protease ATP-binding subunit ClpA